MIKKICYILGITCFLISGGARAELSIPSGPTPDAGVDVPVQNPYASGGVITGYKDPEFFNRLNSQSKNTKAVYVNSKAEGLLGRGVAGNPSLLQNGSSNQQNVPTFKGQAVVNTRNTAPAPSAAEVNTTASAPAAVPSAPAVQDDINCDAPGSNCIEIIQE